MSVACAVPEGASPPPEPPPRDYDHPVRDSYMTISSCASSARQLAGEMRDEKLRARMEACKQGMLQLEALRSKHNRLMQEMRGRLPVIPGCADVQARIKRVAEAPDRSSLQSLDSGVSTSTQAATSRSSSPSVSHRSSVSCDSGCSSVYSTDLASTPAMPYSTYRKLSVEERGVAGSVRSPRDSYPSPLDPVPAQPLPIVATTIASTTCLRSEGVAKGWRRGKPPPQRPRSMYDRTTHEERDPLVDSVSFSQITPPPVHRKFGLAQPQQPSCPRSPLAPVRFSVNSSPQQAHRPLRTAQKPDVVVKAKAARVESPDEVFHASRVFVERSPEALRRSPVSVVRAAAAFGAVHRRSPPQRPRPHSLFEPREDEPLYATPARVLVRDKPAATFAVPRRTAFVPVVSRMVPSFVEKTVRGIEREWRESEGL